MDILHDVKCPGCSRVGKYTRWCGDLTVLYECRFEDCSYRHSIAWADLDALKRSARA